jgi:hypothetical protein
VKTFRRIVRRRLEGALRLRMAAPAAERALRPEMDPLREDIPVELIALDAPIEGVARRSTRRTRAGRRP